MKLEIWSYAQETYELMHKVGQERFASDCRHEKTLRGVCRKCLRKVVTRK